MKQRINLYQSVFQKHIDWFAAQSIGLLCLSVLGVLLLFSVVEKWQLYRARGVVNLLQEDNKKATAQLEELKKQFPEKTEAVQITEEIKQLEEVLAKKTELLQKVVHKAESDRQGFSVIMKGLARQKVEGVWIDNFRLKQGGEQVKLTGYTIRPELIFKLLQGLNQEEVLKGRVFNTFELKQPEKDSPAAIRFVLQTEEQSNQEQPNETP